MQILLRKLQTGYKVEGQTHQSIHLIAEGDEGSIAILKS